MTVTNIFQSYLFWQRNDLSTCKQIYAKANFLDCGQSRGSKIRIRLEYVHVFIFRSYDSVLFNKENNLRYICYDHLEFL